MKEDILEDFYFSFLNFFNDSRVQLAYKLSFCKDIDRVHAYCQLQLKKTGDPKNPRRI